MKFNFLKLLTNRSTENFSNINSNTESLLFLATIIWAVVTLWIPSKLPLIDLPQHAAQVRMFTDILLNQFSWLDIVTINWATPYLSTYFVAMLLSQVMSISSAFKLMLSVAYIAFIYTCVLLRKHYKIDARLDWFFLLPFFGYAYKWGFVPFVLSAPISLWLIYLAVKYSETLSKKYGLLLLVVGVTLLETHGLMFLFSVGVSVCILMLSASNIRSFIMSLWPYVLLMVIFTIAYGFNSHFNASVGMGVYIPGSSIGIIWDLGFRRILQGLVYSIARNNQSMPIFILLPTLLVILASPWLLGMKINLSGKNKAKIGLFILMWVVILLVPNTIYQTSQLYQRFAIFFIPSYFFLFSDVANRKSGWLINGKIKKVTFSFIILCSWSVLAFHSCTNWQFDQSIRSFEDVTRDLDKNQRTFVVANNGENDKIGDMPYNWFAFWFQAEKHGFVEPSFASFASFPVRYKRASDVTDLNNVGELHINTSIPYRYFIVRTTGSLPANQLFQKLNCKPVELVSKEKWKVYDNKHCIKNQQ